MENELSTLPRQEENSFLLLLSGVESSLRLQHQAIRAGGNERWAKAQGILKQISLRGTQFFFRSSQDLMSCVRVMARTGVHVRAPAGLQRYTQ